MSKHLQIAKKKILLNIDNSEFAHDLFREWLNNFFNVDIRRWARNHYGLELLGISNIDYNVQYLVFESEEDRTMFCMFNSEKLVKKYKHNSIFCY